MLNGIADEALDISPKCIAFLEEHGLRMKDALIQLGDIEDEEAADTAETAEKEKAVEEEKAAIKNMMDDDMTQDGQIVC